MGGGGRGRRPDPPHTGDTDAGPGSIPTDGGTTVLPGSDASIPPGTDAGPDPMCTEGLVACGGTCVDVLRDPANCGRCGSPCEGTCESGVCMGACSEPRIDCGGSCVDPSADPFNCGFCGNACAAGELCEGGTCIATSTCTGGRTMCGGACVDTSTSVSNCGSCGRACGVGQACSGGVCGCTGVTMLCGGVCRDLTTDASNCGRCGVACGAGQFCSGGLCTCDGGTACGGACVDTATDPSNCGSCGHACTGGTTCRTGSCVTVGGTGDTCTSPTTVSGAGGAVSFRLDDATANYARSCGGTTATPDRAFSFRPTRSGTATLSAEGVGGTSTDLVLEVFSSSACSTASTLGCNDDRASGDYRPLLSLSVTAGVTYYIVVASYGATAPAESITLSVIAP